MLELTTAIAPLSVPPYTWLRALGAIRPMAPAGEQVLVLGHSIVVSASLCIYPIQWTQGRPSRGIPDEWRIMGAVTKQPITEEKCIALLLALAGVL